MTAAGGQTGERSAVVPGAWTTVGLLWFCGFFNYADRQAVFSVFPLLKDEFRLDDTAKGLIGSAFMVVYALASPFTGRVVDLVARRGLIIGGLALWSAICTLTALSRKLPQLLFFRAAEGLGESCYFPASMSTIADLHGPKTRSRAMSVHQTSVYAGTAFGGLFAGFLGQRLGWRSPFRVLGLVGMGYAVVLLVVLREPERAKKGPGQDPAPSFESLLHVVRARGVAWLLLAFAGANFVAMALLSWMPDYIYRRFDLDLTGSAAVAALFLPIANLFGALLGGWLADRSARRRPGARAAIQAGALLLGAPCVYLVGSASALGPLIPALLGIGLCKGIYDANIFAALYDGVPASARGLAAGLMNTVGWTGGSLAPVLVGAASDRVGLSGAIASTGLVYLVSAAFAALAARTLSGRSPPVD
jgi:MFS family permease